MTPNRTHSHDSDDRSIVRKATSALAAVLITAIILVSPVSAQTGVVVQVPDAEYSFGQHITFFLKATSEATITQVNLFFRVQGETDATVVPSVPFDPGVEVSIEYAYSLVEHNVPPFAPITFWWEVHDEAGGYARSEDRLLYYADNRYEWQHIREKRQDVNWGVYWVKGDASFGQAALDVAAASLDEINRELRTPVPGDIQIYIYPTEEDLRSALNLSGYDWAGGQARPELGAILVGISDDAVAKGEMERLIPHELTHLLIYEKIGRTLGRVPPWLDEGLASLNERRPDPDRKVLVEQALNQDRLIPLKVLCAPFPMDENAARLAYAQSASVVGYLREEYGSQVIRDLLAAYADDISCDAGVSRVLGKDLHALDSSWRADLSHQGQAVTVLKNSKVWLALWLLTILLALPLVGVLRKGSQ